MEVYSFKNWSLPHIFLCVQIEKSFYSGADAISLVYDL